MGNSEGRKIPTVFGTGEACLFAAAVVAVLAILVPGPQAKADLAYRAFAFEGARQNYAEALQQSEASERAVVRFAARLGDSLARLVREQYFTPQKRHIMERLAVLSGHLRDRTGFLRWTKLLADLDPADPRASARLLEAYLWNARVVEAITLMEQKRRRTGFDEQLSRRLVDAYRAIDELEKCVPILEELAQKTGRVEYRKLLADCYHTLFHRTRESGKPSE
jgi:hypothetical protein